MKWYKHITDSLDDPFIFELIEKFGGDGYLVFFGTLEVISREFNIKTPGFCRISERFLTKKLQLSRQKTVKILKFCREKRRIFFTSRNGNFLLNCPKLKKMCDEWTTRQLGSNSGATRDSLHLRNKKKEVRSKIKDNNSSLKTTCPQSKIVDLWKEIIPEAIQPKKWDGTRQTLLRIRWTQNKKCQNLKWWEDFFMHIRGSPFLMGKVEPSKGHSQFQLSLPWVLKEENFLKIVEGFYHRGS